MEVVTDGLRFPEGPIAMPYSSVVLVEIEVGLRLRKTAISVPRRSANAGYLFWR